MGLGTREKMVATHRANNPRQCHDSDLLNIGQVLHSDTFGRCDQLHSLSNHVVGLCLFERKNHLRDYTCIDCGLFRRNNPDYGKPWRFNSGLRLDASWLCFTAPQPCTRSNRNDHDAVYERPKRIRSKIIIWIKNHFDSNCKARFFFV